MDIFYIFMADFDMKDKSRKKRNIIGKMFPVLLNIIIYFLLFITCLSLFKKHGKQKKMKI